MYDCDFHIMCVRPQSGRFPQLSNNDLFGNSIQRRKWVGAGRKTNSTLNGGIATVSFRSLLLEKRKKSLKEDLLCAIGVRKKNKNQRLDGCLRLCAHFISPFLCISHQTPTMHHFHKQSKRLLASALLFVKIVYWQCSRCPSTASTAN